jgi:hypothetical protein
MARIVYDANKIGGAMVAAAVGHLQLAQQLLARAKGIADSVSAGGVTPANLESSAEFGVVVGSGAAFYTALAAMKTNAATVTVASMSDMDNG